MPRKTRKKLARIRNAEMARHALNPLGARAPVADPGHIDAGRGQDSSREEIDPELASFCQRFNLEPQVQDFESDEDGDDADGPEIAEQSELEHFSAVLRHAQQVAIQLEREREISRKHKTPRQYTGNSQKTLYRRKKTKLQLAEKGFLGIFEYLDRHSQRANNRATSPGMTAMTMAVAGVTAANTTAAGATVAADMAAANTTTASSTAANTTPASTTAVNMATANTTATDTTATVAAASTTAASTTAANTMTPTGATAAGVAAANTTAAKATVANATAANTTAPSTMTANTVAASIMAADVTAANTMPVVGATAIGVGPWPVDMDGVEVVTINKEGLEAATGEEEEEMGSDASLEIIERSVEGLPDNKEEVSDNRRRRFGGSDRGGGGGDGQ
ncbi:hypothetical protein EDB85DRAFT_1898189 [Lactarius pseudohatsudake]|nr:hypothetical protein EDB85DRAFT_1898189 [Lactarius pseudohatsudake]